MADLILPIPRTQHFVNEAHSTSTVEWYDPTAMLLPSSARAESIIDLHFEAGLHLSRLLFKRSNPVNRLEAKTFTFTLMVFIRQAIHTWQHRFCERHLHGAMAKTLKDTE
jgi:hypothetical protein